MSTILNATPFPEDLLSLFRDFDCAAGCPPEFWENEINEWIRLDPAAGDGALFWMRKGTQVWVYSDEHGEPIGYGSLCQSKWPNPAALTNEPSLPKIPVSLIPSVGLKREFQGKPDGADPAERFSTKIINHLIYEARQYPKRMPLLCLYVHPQNIKAISFYRRIGFKDFKQNYSHKEAGVTYPGMYLSLAASTPSQG